MAAGIAKAGATDTAKVVAAFDGLKIDGPFGPFVYRGSDHQATMGAYVGKLALKDGKPVMVDFKYVDGAAVLPPDEEPQAAAPVASRANQSASRRVMDMAVSRAARERGAVRR
jgi:branched-chain amino acid transport system substrate-binding protein